MARIESDIKLGFFPTSNKSVQDILDKYFAGNEGKIKGSSIVVCDPCCGEAEVLQVFKKHFINSKTYGIELDGTRAKIANEKVDVFLQGDALSFRKGKGIFDILFLNPPYSEARKDGEVTRLEALFVEKWSESVCVGGYIFLVVTPLSVIEGNIPITLYEKGFSVIDVLFDETSKDYQRFKQYFIILKRVCVSRKEKTPEIISEYRKSILFENAIEMNEVEKKDLEFVTRTKGKILFAPFGNDIKDWQLLEILKKKDKFLFESKIQMTLKEMKSSSIESPNEGQAIILLMAGLVNEKIANRYLMRGECKKISVKQQTSKNGLTTSDRYVGDLYLFDIQNKQYAKLI